MNKICLPDDAKKLIELLQDGGFKAYAVGGCVRDYVMGRSAGDVDITTSATPNEVERLLCDNGIRYIETGLKHGTVTAVLNHVPYEITTFRTDGEYLDNRHPEKVQFVTSLREDLARRDFTVNAIAYNDSEEFVDEFGGIDDINAKIIRAVGDADRRFNEDALRIMRALRFASVLGFKIEDGTKRAIFDNKELLLNIASERIYTELVKLLLGDFCEQVLLEYREVIAVVIPELKPCFDFPQHSKWHLYDVYTHIVKSVALTPKKDYMRLGMLFHDVGKPFTRTTDDNGQDHFKGHPAIGAETADKVLRRLRSSNDVRNKAVALVENHDYHITIKPSNIKKWLRLFGEDMTFDFIDFKIADLASHNLELSQHEIDALRDTKEITKQIIENKEPYKISDLEIDGNDLRKIGYEGHEIADELEKLINEVSGNPACNKKEKLLHIAQTDYKPMRKANRLQGYDYSTNGAYFITICTRNKIKVLSGIVAETNVGEGLCALPRIELTHIGNEVRKALDYINDAYRDIRVEKYVIMPNHIHIMIIIDNHTGGHGDPPLQNVVGQFKSYTTHKYGDNLWQRSFHDHIIRNEEDYLLHLQYIDENPKKWLLGEDEYCC